MRHTDESTGTRTGEDRREFLESSGGTRASRESSRHPLDFRPTEAVEDLIEWVCSSNGGAKRLASGLIPVSYPQIRKMAGDGRIPGLERLLQFVRLAGPRYPFRADLAYHLDHMFDPPIVDPEVVAAEIRERMGDAPVAPDEAAEIVRQVFSEVSPGRVVLVDSR